MIKLQMPIFLSLSWFIVCRSDIIDALRTKANNDNVCSTPECKFAATTILHYIDPNAAPCDDFNKFACGTFLKNTTLPKDKRRVDRYDIVNDQNLERLKVILEEKTHNNEPRWSTLAKNFYKSCINTAAIERNGISGVLGDLKESGGWPVLEKSWNEKKFEWKQTTYTLMKLGYGASYFFTLRVMKDFSNNLRRVLNIDQPPLSIGREFLVKGLRDPTVTAYYKYMVDIAVLFGATRTTAEKDLLESLKFEISLANISKSDEDRSNEATLNNRMTVAMLSRKYPSIPWKVYFNSLYSVTNSSIVIGDNELIIVGEPSFFKDFENLMQNTSKRVQANYQLWRAVQDDLEYLTTKIRKRQLEFTNTINGATRIKDRRQECLEQILETFLKFSVGALYARKHFSKASKKVAEELAVDIENQFKKTIEEAKWMDAKTRINALNRLASMKFFIACPNEYFDDKILDDFFKKVTPEISPDDNFHAGSIMSIFLYNYYFNQLRQPVNTSHWTIHAESYIIGPFFSIEGNGPEIPAGILRDVFFSKDAPKYMNYAGVGSFNIGHEMTHLFDNLDAYMTPETKKTYLANADCITKQYGSYTAEQVGLKLNGAFTRTENINDNSGVRLAYRAYQEWAKNSGLEIQLPGLNKYSQAQLFWIQTAIQQCAKYASSFLKTIVQTDIHSPSKFRIIGTFSNRPEFAKDFNCPLGSKMNPAKKCSVW